MRQVEGRSSRRAYVIPRAASMSKGFSEEDLLTMVGRYRPEDIAEEYVLGLEGSRSIAWVNC